MAAKLSLDAERRHPCPAVERAAQPIGEAAHGRVILEDEDVLLFSELFEPLGVEAVQPGHRHDAKVGAACRQRLRCDERLVHEHGPVRK